MSTPGPESALTPNRQTTITYDIAEYVVQEPPWGGMRMYAEVSPLAVATKGANGRYAANMHFWSCGCWTLRPVQFDCSELEKTYPSLIYDVTV